MKTVSFVFGTRPEAIKFAPVIKEMQKYPDKLKVVVCVSGQHREMLYQVLDFFKIKPDYDLGVMEPSQTLSTVTAKIIKAIEPVIIETKPDLVFVQGDTTTVLMGALGAFYQKVPVAHLEAGLRTYDLLSPFPEELNRQLVSKIARYHFAPTDLAVENLTSEGIDRKNIFMVGNTVIDALLMAADIVKTADFGGDFKDVDFTKKVILVTSHRRESIGEGFASICRAVKRLSKRDDLEVVFPIHYSPAVRSAAKEAGLYNLDHVHIIEPLDYPQLVYIMQKSYVVLTDSGGIQEEAPSLGKPVLVMRDTTERPEGIEAGVAKLVGTDEECIVGEVETLLDNEVEYQRMATAVNPYGDGFASSRIVQELVDRENI